MNPVDRHLVRGRFPGITGKVKLIPTLLSGEVHCSNRYWLGAHHDWRLSYPTPNSVQDIKRGAGPWRGDRVADCAGLEIQCGSNITVGSNPTLSV